MSFLRKNYLWLAGLSYFAIAILLTSDVLSRHALIGKEYLAGLPYWITWWVWHAFDKNYDLVYNNFTLYPIKTNLLPILSLPTSGFYYVLRPFLGSLLAFNALFPLYLGLNGWASFLFLRRQVKVELWAVVGGLLIAFNPLTFALVERGEIALLGFWVLPLWMILWDRLLEKRSFGRLLLAVLGLYGVVIMSLQFWNLMLTLLLPYALLRGRGVIRQDRHLADLLLLGGLLFALLCLLYPVSPFLWSTYGEVYAPLEVWQAALSLGGAGWLIFAGADVIGLLAVILMPAPALAARRWWLAIIALNLLCYWQNGLAPLSLFFGISAVPHTTNLTRNALFVIPAALASAVLVLPMLGAGLDYGLQRKALSPLLKARSQGLKPLTYVLLVVVIISTAGWLGDLPSSPMQDYDFYHTLADDSEDYVIIDFPLAADSLARRSVGEVTNERGTYTGFFFPDQAGRTLTQVPIHHKRIVSGLTGALYDHDLAPYRDLPLIRLLAFDPIDAHDSQTIIEMRDQVLRQRIGYVILHDPQGAIAPEFMASIRGWLNWIGSFCLVGSESDLELWRARWHPAGCAPYTVQLGGADGLLATGEKSAGWGQPIFLDNILMRPAGGALTSRLTLWATASHAYRLTLRGRAADGLADQSVIVRANGRLLGKIALTPQWAEVSLDMPRDAILQGGQVVLTLQHDHAAQDDARSTALYEWMKLEPAP